MTTAELDSRHDHFIHLMIRNADPNVSAYRLWGHRNLDDCYGEYDAAGGGTSDVGGAGPVQFAEVSARSAFRSTNIVRQRRGMLIDGSDIRHWSRVIFDLDDYNTLPEMPLDTQYLYVRIQDLRITLGAWETIQGVVNNGDPVLGPIYLVPPPNFFSFPNAPINIQGTAPANTGALAGSTPPRNLDGQLPPVMSIVLPRPGTVTIRNVDPAIGLLYSFNEGESMIQLPFLEETITFGGVKRIFVASTENTGVAANGVPFTISGVLDLSIGI